MTKMCGRDGTGGDGARFGHAPAGVLWTYDFAVSTGQGFGGSGLRFQGELAGMMPSRISAAIRLDQKARVLPVRICGLRFNAKKA